MTVRTSSGRTGCVLFGQHFAAISGARSSVGPILAAQMGYLPSVLWIILGVMLRRRRAGHAHAVDLERNDSGRSLRPDGH